MSTSTESRPPMRVVVLVSGRGSNLQALLDARERLPIELLEVISNRPGVQALHRAEQAGVPATVLDHTGYSSREAFDQALGDHLEALQPDLIVLAGFMRILTPAFVRRFRGRMINLHPSLLPKYPGLHTHQRALDAGDREAGASIHLVTEELDGGPVIMQARVAVQPDDDADRLAARILPLEHQMLLQVVERMARGEIQCRDDQVFLNGERLEHPLALAG